MAKKILLIEDDKFLRKVIVRKLTADGYEVIEAIDGEKGVVAAREGKPDLILLDLVLPEIDGFEVLAMLKKDKETFKIPVIILSNLGEKENVEKGLKMGANDYLIKARLEPSEIAERIQKILNQE
ncbi:hypothetical protein AMJ47_03780 [Parcubacteria bacterium DG_72]|nr:MAG: hypothetical protein AMJ47_03780 [Parcubacteria bacterium DG_72]